MLTPLLAVSLLSGCGSAPPATETRAATAPVPKPKPKPSPKIRQAVPVPPPKPSLPETAEEADVADTAKPVQLQALVGLDEAAIIRILGTPTDQRAEGAARVWSYGGGACRLDLYFFRDVTSGGRHALAYRLDGQPTEPACLSAWRGP